MRSAPTNSDAAWQQELAGVGRREREDGHGKRRDQERAPEQCGTGDETDDESEGEIARPEHGEIEHALAFGHHLLAKKRQQGGRADQGQPHDARLLEPPPSAALVENIGEAEECDRDQQEAGPVERKARGRNGSRAVRDQQKSNSGEGNRNNAEENPCPGLAVDQPSLKRGGYGCRERRRIPSQTAPAGSAARIVDRREK